PQQLVFPVVTGAFTFDWTPGMDVADEFAFWSMSFLPFCSCLLPCVWFGSPDEPLQQPEPSCSDPCCCLEPWSWSIVCAESFWFSADEFAVELLLWSTLPPSPPAHTVLQSLLATVTGSFTFVCTPGTDVAVEFAF